MAINVLVVDDSAIMRSMVIRTLTLSGLEIGQCHEAGNGLEALQILQANWVDLAIIDINMPVMNGEELLKRLRIDSLDPSLPVIIVSTEGSETRIQRLKDMGADFMQKPFQPEALRDLILKKVGLL